VFTSNRLKYRGWFGREKKICLLIFVVLSCDCQGFAASLGLSFHHSPQGVNAAIAREPSTGTRTCTMLTFAEEILLLALDDQKGTIKPLPAQAMKFALAGALLMELALADRIDTDLRTLKVVDAKPTDDALLDEVLNLLQTAKTDQSTQHWLNELAWQCQNMQEQVLQQLVDKGVLKIEDRKILWVFAMRRYPLMDDREVKEVRTRLRDLILGNDIPDPREGVLVGLVNACGLFDDIFTEDELARVRPRIAQLVKLDLIGREVNRSLNEISLAVAASMPAMM
jgi:golgi phosphoprotein 3